MSRAEAGSGLPLATMSSSSSARSSAGSLLRTPDRVIAVAILASVADRERQVFNHALNVAFERVDDSFLGPDD